EEHGMSTCIRIAGAFLWLLTAAHVLFPRRFQWREELARLSLLNRQIFIVHCLFIVLILALMGALCVFYSDRLLQPAPLARVVLAGLTTFWTARLAAQWLIYDRSLWRGDRKNTSIHLALSALWTYLLGTFAAALCQQL